MSATFLIDMADTTLLGRSISSSSASTTSANGTSIDMQLSDGPIHALVDCSASSGTTPKCVVQLQHSTDNSTWTNIPAEDVNQPANVTLTTSGLSILSTNQRLGRYVRATTTITGTSPSFTLSVIVIGRKRITGSGVGNQTDFTPGSGF